MSISDPPPPSPREPADDGAMPRVGPAQLFAAFNALALSGFGGVLPFAYRALVERRRWLVPQEFAGLLAMAQVMPGPTICNLAVMIGQRHAGFAGACAAVAGLVLGPSCIVIALGIAWQHYGGIRSVQQALTGMSAVAIGLILATAVKMGIALFGSKPASPDGIVDAPGRSWSLRRVAQLVLCAVAFAGVGLMRWPLAAVVACLAPFAIALSWFGDP